MAVEADSPESALRGIAQAYMSREADAVLSYFAEDARVIGSLRHEDWSRRDDVRDYLGQELESFGDLQQTFLGGPEEALELVVDTESVKVFTLPGELSGTFRGRAFSHDGRWTCVLRYDSDGWRVVHSHFSLSLA